MKIQYKLKRNPLIEILNDSGSVVYGLQTIGDPHLGRVFKTGVPAHRIGERESSLFSTFKRKLNNLNPKTTHVIVPGDLFDRFIVSPTVVGNTYSLIIDAAINNPHIQYIFIPGNHDLSKYTDNLSSYSLLYLMLLSANLSNLTFLMNEDYSLDLKVDDKICTLYFDCYSPFEKQISNIDKKDYLIAFGHWDSNLITGKEYLPSKDLLSVSDLIVSGHEHVYKEHVFDNTKALFTGSMLPYSHAEDPDQEIYMTIKVSDLHKHNLQSDFKYKCLRILVEDLLPLDEQIEAFSITYKVLEKEKQTVEVQDVTVDNYTEKLIAFIDSSEFSDENKDHIKQLIMESS